MADVELECLENYTLALQDLIPSVALLRHEYELIDRWRQNLFIFRSNKHCSNADQLEFDLGDNTLCQEAVNNVDGDP